MSSTLFFTFCSLVYYALKPPEFLLNLKYPMILLLCKYLYLQIDFPFYTLFIYLFISVVKWVTYQLFLISLSGSQMLKPSCLFYLSIMVSNITPHRDEDSLSRSIDENVFFHFCLNQ